MLWASVCRPVSWAELLVMRVSRKTAFKARAFKRERSSLAPSSLSMALAVSALIWLDCRRRMRISS
jgi:hypothetical protein